MDTASMWTMGLLFVGSLVALLYVIVDALTRPPRIMMARPYRPNRRAEWLLAFLLLLAAGLFMLVGFSTVGVH